MSTETVTLKRLNVVPPLSRLAFGFDCPPQWKQLDIPTDTPDFSDPGAFMPMAVFMSPLGAILFSVAARPRFEDGSVYDWARFLLEHHGLKFTALMPGRINGVQCIRAMATQAGEAGDMQLSVAIFEDGGSIVQISGMAPVQVWPSLADMFEQMIDSFALRQPQGTTAPIVAGQDPPMTEFGFRALALSEEGSTLTDGDHPINAHMRDNGIGLLPRVLSMDEAERFAMMGCGAIMASVPVPFGWHIFDDGKRTLVFTADNAIQINMSLIPTGGLSIDQGMDSILETMVQEQPQAEHHKLDLDGTPTLAFKGLNVNGEVLSQVLMFKELPSRPGLVFQSRVTAAEPDLYRAMDAAGLMLKRMSFFE